LFPFTSQALPGVPAICEADCIFLTIKNPDDVDDKYDPTPPKDSDVKFNISVDVVTFDAIKVP
jgi:hypothetical protein